jgi:hypothetical protein
MSGAGASFASQGISHIKGVLMKYLLAIAAGGLATYLVLKRREAPASTGGSRVDAFERNEPDEGASMRSFADESPNEAERLRDEGLVGSPTATAMPSDDLFSSSSQRGEEPVTPGLPDLTRGA